MAIETFQRSVTTAASLLYVHATTASSSHEDYSAKRVALINVSASPTTVYLGPTGVTTSTGARWIIEAGRTLSVSIEPGESLYAILASGTQSIDVITSGR